MSRDLAEKKLQNSAICLISGKLFQIRATDIAFYERMGVPAPRLCPAERDRRRLAFRNERNLYRRNCSKTGRSMISMFAAETEFPVYERDVWWSDVWDAREYARDFDFNRTFFEQFRELQRVVPRFSLYRVGKQENTEYTHHSADNRNCHLCFSVVECQDCYFSDSIDKTKDSIDCTYVNNSELCYSCLDCSNCYMGFFLQDCHHTSESILCADLRSCSCCICCTNLSQKSYHIFNKPVSRQEFELARNEILGGNREVLAAWQEKFLQFRATQFRKGESLLNCENCSGLRIKNCKNVFECFDVLELEDCAYTSRAFESKDVQDVYATYRCTAQYYTVGSEISYGGMAFYSYFDNFSWYVEQCHHSEYLFGCIGLKKSSNCILNKQYSHEDFIALRDRIVAHMKNTGEWGEFFPLSLSPWGYNQSQAMDYYPLNREEAIKFGANWYDDPTERLEYKADGVEVFLASQLPRNISQVDDRFYNKAVICEHTKKAFKIIPQEISFYRRHGLPLPTAHPDARFRNRLAKRCPRKIWQRPCDQCTAIMVTGFEPHFPARVLCTDCYRRAVE